MYKAIVLIATLCATLVAASQRDTRINNRFALTVSRREALRQKHGLGQYAQKRLTQEDGETPPISPNPNGGGQDNELIGCARGLTKGLQFSANSEGACYVSVDETLNAANDFTNLLLKAYNPTVWADIMTVSSEYTDYLAAIQTNCDFQKLLNTFTTDITTLVPQIAARLTGGVLFEIPRYYVNIRDADSCQVIGYNVGKLFSMVFDYYL